MSVYPFAELSEFERFRSLALEDPPAARLRATMRQTPDSRSIVRIYYGPPGTGKTLQAVRHAVELADPSSDTSDMKLAFARFNELAGQVAFVTFHQSLQYEDVVESIRPALTDASSSLGADAARSTDEDGAGGPSASSEANVLLTGRYVLHAGPIMRIIRAAAQSPEQDHVLVIDEINRGDISRILGPLISALEPDKRAGADFPIGFEAQYPRAGSLESRVFLPPNLHILGTMNSADRNIALVDHALRRRFDFVECPPEPETLTVVSGQSGRLDLKALLEALNQRIRHLLDGEHRIGHGYLMGCTDPEDAVTRFARRILPLLNEYFYADPAGLLLTVRDTFGGSANIHLIERPDDTFADVFGVDLADAQALGYQPQQAQLGISLDPRFWNPHTTPPGPTDMDYAVNALRKIYETDAAHPDASGAADTPGDPAGIS